MPNLIPFEFENHTLRVNMDAAGNPWFNVNDVCQALELGNPRQAIKTHVEEEDVQKMDTLTPGGQQLTSHVNEYGLYALILGSTKEAAKRFKHWVTHEVLPSIRKTGAYALPTTTALIPNPAQDQVAALLLIGDAVAKVPGVKHGIAMAATLTCIHQNTGLTLESLRLALPACNESQATLNPTKLGERIGISARSVNLRLANLGLQQRNDRDEWELTEAGQVWAEALPYSRNGHSGYQILWNAGVIDLMKEAA